MANKKSTSKKSNTNARKDLAKDIFLVSTIGFCILLFLSYFGIIGKFGNALAGFFFGLFGIIAYIFPFLLLVAVFFIALFYRLKFDTRLYPSIIVGLSTLIYICIGAFIELCINGANPIKPILAFKIGYDNKSGGGLFGGGIAYMFYQGFGRAGAFIFVILIIAICAFCVVFFSSKEEEGGLFEKFRRSTSRAYEKKQDKKRRENNRKEVERRKRILDEEHGVGTAKYDGNVPRRERKVSGVDFANTSIKSTEPEEAPVVNNNNINTPTNDGMNLVNINMMSDKNDEEIEPTEYTRVSLKSGEESGARIHFSDEKESVVEEKASVSSNTVDNTVAPTPNTESLSSTNNESLASQLKTESQRKKVSGPYKFPPLNLLTKPTRGGGETKQTLSDKGNKLIHVLDIFGIKAELGEITCGPTVTRFEITPEIGTKVSKITNLADDIQLNLAAKSIRIEAPIPGKSTVGIEIPNDSKTAVSFYDLMSELKKRNKEKDMSKLTFALGKDIPGDIIFGDLAKMPHMLIAGTTGSGKSVCVNSIIMSILYNAAPDDVRFIMIDPKMVEFTKYNGLPHLLIPVVTDAKEATKALNWAVSEMMSRYDKMSKAQVNKYSDYNNKVERGLIKATNESGEEIVVNEKMNQIVIVIDELADLMMVAAKEVEASIARIAQLARAAGIHLIVATQRPSADVVTGLIRTNIPSRIALSVSNAIDSRIIIGEAGAENLLGNGDMLYAPIGCNNPTRVQGVYVPDDDVLKVINYIIENNAASSDEKQREVMEQIQKANGGDDDSANAEGPSEDRDQYFEECGRLIIDKQKGSIGMLQRNFRIGFNRAARIMDQLEGEGVVGPEVGTKPRSVLVTMDEFEEILIRKNQE